MLAIHLCRDQRLRACGFRLDAMLPSGRRFWRVEGGFLPLDAGDCDALLDMLVEYDFLYAGPGLWKWENGETYTTIDAIAEVRREMLFMLKLHESGVQ